MDTIENTIHEVPATAKSKTQGRFICPQGNYYQVTIRWAHYALYGAPQCPCRKGEPHDVIFLQD